MGKRAVEKPHGEDPDDSGELAKLEMEFRRHREQTDDRFAQLQASILASIQSTIEASFKSSTAATQASIAGLQLLVSYLDKRVSIQAHPVSPSPPSSLGLLGPAPQGTTTLLPLPVSAGRVSPNWSSNPNSASSLSPQVVYSEPMPTRKAGMTSLPYSLGCDIELNCAVGGCSGVGSSLEVNTGSRNSNYGEPRSLEELWVQDCGDGVRIVDRENVRNVRNRSAPDIVGADFRRVQTGVPQCAPPAYSTVTTTREGPEFGADYGHGQSAGFRRVHQGGQQDHYGRRGLQDLNEQWGHHPQQQFRRTGIGVVCDANGFGCDMFRRTRIGVLCDAIRLDGDGFSRTRIGMVWEANGVDWDMFKRMGINVFAGLRMYRRTYSDCFVEALVMEAEKDKDIVTVHAEMHMEKSLELFGERFHDKFFDVGMAEQYAVTSSAGLARGGLKPFYIIPSTFLQRAYDQELWQV